MSTRARLGLCGAVLVIGLVCMWAAFVRSLIPASIDGTITDMTYVGATTGRARQLRVGNDLIEVDRPVAEAVKVGDQVSKQAWEPTLHVRSKNIALQAGPEVLQFALLTPLAVGVTWLLTRRRPGSAERAVKDPATPAPA